MGNSIVVWNAWLECMILCCTHRHPKTNHLHFCNKILSHIKLRVYRSHILRNVWLLLPYEEELAPARSWYKNTYISRTQNPTAFVLQQIVCQECRSQFLCSSSRRNKSFRVENSLRDQKQLYCMHAHMACDFWFYKGRKKVHSITWANVSWALGSQWRWCWLLPHYHHHCDCLCCDPGAS